MKRHLSFEQLRQTSELQVVNPDTGSRFIISLRGWQNTLWAVRIIPSECHRVSNNPFTTAHRLMSRSAIEEWLSQLEPA
jgi:hypothetical protein